MGKWGDGKPEDLDITSIGSIYNGPWDKKYWSSSRGKDRYPYPVGYQAVRTHNGRTYKMEIHASLKGPLFVINSNGVSNSGQTPNIAWESFQKGCPGLKMSHGKKSSRRIDGAEFFGFKNPFIQRLLREVMTSVNATADRSLLSPSFSNKDSKTQIHPRSPDSCTKTDGLPYVERSQFTRKKSRQYKSTYTMLDDADRQYNSNGSSASIFPVATENGKTCSCEGGTHLESSVSFNNLKVGRLFSQEDNIISRGNCESTKIDSSLSKNQEPLDRSQDIEIEGFNSLLIAEDKDGKKNCLGITHKDFCASDTLDLLQDNNSAPASLNVENSLVVAEALSERMNPEGVDTSISNQSYEMSDFDSVGPEIAKSMMTLLLPQALPLLNGSKKKSSVKPCRTKFNDTNNEHDHPVDVIYNAKMVEDFHAEKSEKLDVLSANLVLVLPTSEHINSVIPDSFENDDSGSYVENHEVLFSDACAAKKTFDKDACTNNLEMHGTSVDAQIKSPFNCLDASGKRELLGHDSHVPPHERLSKVDVHISESSPDFSHPRLRVFSRRFKKSKYQESYYEEVVKSGANSRAEIQPMYASKKKDASIFCNPVYQVEESYEGINLKPFEDQEHAYSDGTLQITPKLETPILGNNISIIKEVQDASCLSQKNINLSHEPDCIFDLVGCYMHPMPVLSVMLNTNGNFINTNDIFICVICGLPMEKDRIMYLYKVPITDQKSGNPSFIGRVQIIFSTSKDIWGRDIVMERSIQFTPVGQYLVFINIIKAPHCRGQEIDCSCAACAQDINQVNGVKIVKVELGHVSVVAKLKAADSVTSTLVCGPSHLVAVEESGKINLWVMNAKWSAQVEHFTLPTYDCIVELKRIPRCNHLLVGHNGFGEFGLWDISKHILISRFCAPIAPVFNFFPVSLFNWEIEGHASKSAVMEEQINRIIDSTRVSFSEHCENYVHLTLEDKNIAVWLLVSIDSDAQGSHKSSGYTNLGQWRLALLVKNLVILGSPLDPRAAIVGASSDHGIIGTRDGLVYVWNVITGTKLGILHNFEGKDVSCIAVDDSWPYLLGVACGAQLRVYLPSQKIL